MPNGAPDLDRRTVAWVGVNTDGLPALGRLVVKYRGPIMLDDGATPVSIYPEKRSHTIAATELEIDGQVRTVGYATFDLPVTNDPDVFGSGGVYLIHEDLDSGEGVDRFGIIDVNASGTVWLNTFLPVTSGQPVVVPDYQTPFGAVVTQAYSDGARRFVPGDRTLLILGGTSGQQPEWALPGDLYASVTG